MTDNEIIKALECCSEDNKCNECPYGIGDCLEDGYKSIVIKDALDLINRQQTEIEKLNVELVGMRGACESYKLHYDNAQAKIERLKAETKDLHKICDKAIKTYKETKSEARKDFAMSLVEISYIPNMSLTGEYVVSVSDIKNLLKEMESESDV